MNKVPLNPASQGGVVFCVIARALIFCSASYTLGQYWASSEQTDGGDLAMALTPDIDDLWNFGDPTQSLQRFRDLYAQTRATAPAAYTVEVLTQTARAQGLLGDFSAAHHTLDEAEGLIEDVPPRVQVRCLLERGRVYNANGNPNDAKPFFEQAWTVGRKAGEDALSIDAAHMMAIVERPPRQQEWNIKALEVVENSSDRRAKKWYGSLYNNIGWAYHDAGDFGKALEAFEKALAWRAKEGDTPQIRTARWCVGRCLRSLGRVEEALEKQKGLLKEFAEAEEEDGYVFEEIGECLYLLEQKDAARKWFAKAYATLLKNAWIADNEVDRLERLKRLGRRGAAD